MKPADLARAYLIIGTDELKRNSAVNKLKTYVNQEWQDMDIDEFDASSSIDVPTLSNALNAFPFVSEIKLVIIHSINTVTKDISSFLVDYLSNPNPTTVLCCEGTKLAKNTVLYKALAKVDPKSIVEFAELKKYELPDNAMKIAQSLGASLDRDAAQELVERLGDSSMAIQNQVKTLVEIYGAGRITKQIVQDSVARVAEVNPWTFLNYLSERNVIEALRLLNAMNKPSYVFLLGIIYDRLRELICAESLIARGSSNTLANELSLQQWQVKNHLRYARMYKQGELENLLIEAGNCEMALKSSPDSETAFINYILKFAKN